MIHEIDLAKFDATGLLNYIRSQGWCAALVGGAVRDSLHGVQPKDYDVAVWVDTDTNKRFSWVCDQLGETIAHNLRQGLHSALTPCSPVTSNYSCSQDNFSDKWSATFKLNIQGLNVDILVSTKASLESIIREFDCNLNQVSYDGSVVTEHYGANPPSNGFKLLKDNVCPERTERMRGIWSKLYDSSN